MRAAPLRLGSLARTLDRTGRMALRDGAELRRLALTVTVAEPPVLDPARLWRIAVAQPPRGWWARLLARLAVLLRLAPRRDWPQVRLVWEAGAVFAELAPSDPPELR